MSRFIVVKDAKTSVAYFANLVHSSVPYFADAVTTPRPVTIPTTTNHGEGNQKKCQTKQNKRKTKAPLPSLHALVHKFVSAQRQFSKDGQQHSIKLRNDLKGEDEPEVCYGGVARHSFAARNLKKESDQSNKTFLHLNAGGMLGRNIRLPILGELPAAEFITALGYTAVVSQSIPRRFHTILTLILKIVWAGSELQRFSMGSRSVGRVSVILERSPSSGDLRQHPSRTVCFDGHGEQIHHPECYSRIGEDTHQNRHRRFHRNRHSS